MRGGTKETICVHCGRSATRMNPAKQPVCKEHRGREAKELACPDCGFSMRIKEGRYGYFWGCEGYPGCKKTISLRNAFKMHSYRDPDIDIALED